MAKKIEVSVSEYEWLQQTVKDYAYSIALLDVENQKLKQELEKVKNERDALLKEVSTHDQI